MATHPLASLAHRGRGVLVQSTVLHVLRLVHSGYVALPAASRPSLQHTDRMPLRLSRRHASSAHAVQEDDPERSAQDGSSSEQRLSPDTPPPIPPPYRPPEDTSSLVSAKKSGLPQSLIDTVLNFHTTNLPTGEQGPSAYAAELKKLDSSVRDIRATLQPLDLAHVDAIREILVRFQDASLSQWTWLAEKLGEMTELVHKEQITVDPALAPLTHAFIAYCLFQQDQHCPWDSLPHRARLIRIALEKSIASRRALSHRLPTLPLEHSLRAVAFARIHDWDEAKNQAFQAVPGKMAKREYPPADTLCLDQYRESLMPAGRAFDFIDIIIGRYRSLFPIFIWETAYHHPRRDLADIFYKSLASLAQPVEWYEDKLRTEPSTRTRWLGTILFMALARWPDEVDNAMAILHRLVKSHFFVPGHQAADLCLHLTMQNRSEDVLEVFKLYIKSQPDPSPSVCRRFMNTLTANGLLIEAAAVQDMVVRKHNPSHHDRTVVAMAYARRGDVKGTIQNLRDVYGPELVLEIAALKPLLIANISADHVEGVRKVLEHILEIEPHSILFNTALRYLADRGEALHALEAYDQFNQAGGKATIHTYTALVHLFGRKGDLASLERIIRLAIADKVPLDGPFCAEVLDASSHAGDWAGVATRIATFPSEIKNHPHVVTALLKAFVFMAVPFEVVERMFGSIKSPTKQQWSLVIMSACDKGDLEKARALLDQMDKMSKDDPKAPAPTAYTYSVLLHGLLRRYKQKKARALYDEMVERNLMPSSLTYSMIIQSYLRFNGGGYYDQAHAFALKIHAKAQAGELPERGAAVSRINANLFGQLVQAAGKIGRTDSAQAYFDLATESREPSPQLSTQLMEAYRLAGDVDQVLTLWGQVFEKAKSMVDSTEDSLASASRSNMLCVPLSITIDSLSSRGRYADIQRVWNSVREAGFGFDASNFQHYAVALARSGDLHGAFWIIDRVIMRQWDKVLRRRRRDRDWRRNGFGGLNTRPMLLTEEERNEQESLRTFHIEEDRADESVYPKLEELLEYPGPMDKSDIRSAQNPVTSPSTMRGIARQRLQDGVSSTPAWQSAQADDYAQKILQSWRPADNLWRPSVMTKMVISHVYGQVQLRKRQLEKLLDPINRADVDEGETDPRDGLRRTYSKPHVVTLPDFNDVPIRGADGLPVKTTPRAILWKLNRLFPRVIVMIMRFRARKEGRKYDSAVAQLQHARLKEQQRRKWWGGQEKLRHKWSSGTYTTSVAKRQHEMRRRSEWRAQRELDYVLPELKVVQERRPRFGKRFPDLPDLEANRPLESWSESNYRHHGLSSHELVKEKAAKAKEEKRVEEIKEKKREKKKRYIERRKLRQQLSSTGVGRALSHRYRTVRERMDGEERPIMDTEVLLRELPAHLVRKSENVQHEGPKYPPPKGW